VGDGRKITSEKTSDRSLCGGYSRLGEKFELTISNPNAPSIAITCLSKIQLSMAACLKMALRGYRIDRAIGTIAEY
jgi:hypothetical protein